MATVDGLLMSFVTTLALPGQILEGRGFPLMSRQDGYFDAYQSASPSGRWCKPWDGERSFNTFWRASLSSNYRAASQVAAWKKMIPLKESVRPQLRCDLPGVEVDCDRFLFPLGIGTVFTAQFSGSATVEEVVVLVRRLADEPVMRLAGSSRPQAVKAMAAELLAEMQKFVLGELEPAPVGESKPTMVVTVTKSSGWQTTPPNGNDDLTHLLNGLCGQASASHATMSSDFESALLSPAKDYPGTTRIKLREVHGIWSPRSAARETNPTGLVCYHQNQVLATLHAGILLAAVKSMGDPPLVGRSSEVQGLLRIVVRLLGQLYGKSSEVYSSDFIRRQIDDSGLVPTINSFRQSLGIGGQMHV